MTVRGTGHCRRVNGFAIGCATVAAAVSMTACTGAARPGLANPTPTAANGSPVAPHGPAVRWWSNSGATAGSTIDPRNPAAVATQLAPDRAQYCEMLAQTMQSGKSILSGVSPQDPVLLNSAIAFVTEVQRVAPGSVAGSWRTLGPAILALIAPSSSAAPASTIDASRTAAATNAIAADAKRNCGLNLAARGAH